MAQGGGQAGGMGASPMGGQQGMMPPPPPQMGGMGGGQMQLSVMPPQGGFGPGVNNFGGPQMGQLGMMGGQQGMMPQQGGFGPNPNNFGSPQGMMPPPSPRFAQFGGPEYERGYPQPQGPRGFNQGPRTEDDWNRFATQARFASQADMEKAKADFLAQGNQMPQQGMGQIPKFSSPFFQQMQQMQQQTPQQPQVQAPDLLANPIPTVAPVAPPPPSTLPRQQYLTGDKLRKAERQQRREENAKVRAYRDSLRNPKPAPKGPDFSRMSQAGQFGDQGFAQTLQNYAGQQYKDYAYNPGDQKFYKAGDKTSQGIPLGQILQQGRAAGYKMAHGGIASLRRR